MCGPHVVLRGEPAPDGSTPGGAPAHAPHGYRAGAGVGAALLRRAGVRVIAQRDEASLQALVAALDPTFAPDPAARDFPRHPWYRSTFGDGST